MRTASRGGRCPSRRKRRTLLYEARSTSMEKVESGLSLTRRNGFSSKRPYSSVLNSRSTIGISATRIGATPIMPPTTPPATPPTTPPSTPPCSLAMSCIAAGWLVGGGGEARAGGGGAGAGGGGSCATRWRASLSLLHAASAREMNSTADRMSTTLSSVDRTGIIFGFLRMRSSVSPTWTRGSAKRKLAAVIPSVSEGPGWAGGAPHTRPGPSLRSG